MPRRYKLGPEGEMRRAWGGKLPEEFDQRDMLAFMAETDLQLQGAVSAETLTAIHAAGYDYMGGAVIPRPGKEEEDLSNDVLLTPEQIAAEERRWLFESPIAELAEVKGVTIDEAVKMRTDAVLQEAVIPIEVSVRPIEPQGKLIGFASVNFGGVVVDDFKVVNGQNGVFLGAPSKPDPTSRMGYRSTVQINDGATQERLNAAGAQAYQAAVEKLLARAEAVRPAPIREQMDQAGKEAAQKNAARSGKGKGGEGCKIARLWDKMSRTPGRNPPACTYGRHRGPALPPGALGGYALDRPALWHDPQLLGCAPAAPGALGGGALGGQALRGSAVLRAVPI